MALPENIQDILPLSPVQSGMLFHSIADSTGSGAYVGVVSVFLEGALDPARFRRAFTSVVQSRDVLRASFVYKDIKTPVQVIHRHVDIPWQDSDWSQVTAEDFDRQKREHIKQERRVGFDLSAPPLMRVHLIRLEDDKHFLIWSLHHILSDGWSTTVVLDDVLRQYESDGSGSDREAGPKASFRDYLAWLKKRDKVGAEDYWSRLMADFQGPTRIEALRPARTHSDLHQIKTRRVPGTQTERLNRIARGIRVTQSSFLAALWVVILRRYSGSEDVTFGVTTAGRPVDLPGVAAAVGPFLNTLPIRITADAETSFEALTVRVETLMRARAPHEFSALTEVRSWSGVPPGQQLFDALFAHESLPELDTNAGSLRLSEIEIIGPSNYGIALVVTPVDGLKLEIYFDPALYSSDLIDAILSDYADALDNAVKSPLQQVSSLLISNSAKAEVSQAVVRDFPAVVTAFYEVVDQFPDAPAVSDNTETLNYRMLRERVEQILQQLVLAGVKPGDIVPVAVERSAQAVASYLGVMSAGAAYIPLDLEYPKDRLRQILSAAAPRVVLTTSTAKDGLPEGAWNALCIDMADTGASPKQLVAPSFNGSAYVLFTSGSQGVPKGVVISHRALAHSTFVRNEVFGAAPKSFLLLSSFAFDSSIAGLYWTICTGGHLVIAPRQVERDPAALGALLEKHEISHTLCLPGLHGALLDAVDPAKLASLKTVVVAGEAVQAELIERHRAVLPHCRLFNEYGPTEATVWATAYDTADWHGTGAVPIGVAIPGVDVAIRDIDGVAMPDGVQGEISIAGPTLADGYLNDVDKSADIFPEFPEHDGTRRRVYRTGDLGVSTDDGLFFYGRLDQQIKIRGHRVEAGEIETLVSRTLGEIPCCALKVERNQTSQLVICIQGQQNPEAETRLQRVFETSLPEPARPRRITWKTALPRLPNGKLDRIGMARTIGSDPEVTETFEAPKFGAEAKLAQIWRDVLGSDTVSRDANFFDLGGDSLKTISLYALAEREGFVLSPNDIFEHPTLREFTAQITASAQNDLVHIDAMDVRKVHSNGTQPPVVILHSNMLVFNQLARGLGEDRPVGLKFSSLYETKNLSLGATIEGMANETISEFADFLDGDACVLIGYSAGATVALQMANVLKERGCEVSLLCLVDPPLSLREPLGTWNSVRCRLNRILRSGFEIGRFAALYVFLTISGPREKRRRFKINCATALAMNRYEANLYEGKVLLLSTLQMDAPPDRFPEADVENLAFEHLELVYNRDAAHLVSSRLIAHIRKT